MTATILLHEFTGLLYIMSACLIFLIITPKFLFTGFRRKLFFILILIVFSYFYLGYENIDPFIYVIHLIPICLTLAALFEGMIPALATWVIFLFSNMYIVHNDWLPAWAGTVMLMAFGLWFHYRHKYGDSRLTGSIRALIVLTAYFAGFIPLYSGVPLTEWGFWFAVLGSYLSNIFVSFVYYQVKNQEKMHEELISAEKYQMVGQLAAAISHEIRNPLTTSLGFLQLMNREYLTTEQFKRYREYAIEGINSANSIITDYLNYAKPTVEEPGPLHVANEIDGMVPWISTLTVLSNIELDIKHESLSPIYIMGESRKFQQCLLNIMKNAIEAMPGGGVLTIQTRLENNNVHIHIKDTGVGMSEDQIKRVGMPFYSTKEKGTGLGLMVVTSLIHSMDGKLSYVSKPNQGTTCRLQFKQMPGI